MKKLFYCFLLLAFVPVLNVNAQSYESRKIDSLERVIMELNFKLKEFEKEESVWENRAKYFNIGYVQQTLSNDENPELEWKSEMGFFLSRGRTYYLHKKPLLKTIKFGLDLTIPDISYAKYEYVDDYGFDPDYDSEMENIGMHQAEIGIHIGPSITVNPVGDLKLAGYFHAVPSASMILIEDEFNVQFVPFLTFGGSISYKVLSVGIESRWGSATYDSLSLFDGDYGYEEPSYNSVSRKLNTQSTRFYLSFRF